MYVLCASYRSILKKVCSLVACVISTTHCCQGTCVAQTMVPCSCQNVNVHVLKVPGFILEWSITHTKEGMEEIDVCVALTSIASHCFFSLSKEKRDFDTLFPELHASCAFHLTAHCCLSRSKEAKVGSTMQQQHITYLRCFITHLCYYYNYTIHISIPTRHMFAF